MGKEFKCVWRRSASWSLLMASTQKVTFEVINKHMKAVAPPDIAKYHHSICICVVAPHEGHCVLHVVQKRPFEKSFALGGAGFSPKTIKHLMSLSLHNKKVHLYTHLLHIYFICTLYLQQYICLEAEGSLTFPKPP